MQDSGICGIPHVLVRFNIVRQCSLKLISSIANLVDGFFTGDDLLSGGSTSALDDTIDVHVANLPVLTSRPVLSQHLCREGSVLENVVEDGASFGNGHVELAWRHEVTNDVASFERQSVVFAVLSSGGGAREASRASC